MSEKKWVDFKSIKQKVTMEMVLVRYGLLHGLQQTPRGFKGPCPVHKGKHPNQFHMDPVKNRWNCFGGCDMEKFEGHVIGFVSAMEGVDLREAALMLADWFNLDTERPNQAAPARRKTPAAASVSAQAPEPVVAIEVPNNASDEPENKELTFELKNLSADHPFFAERGIAPETIEHYGLGLCTKGLMKDRIVFPIHRPDGKLIGYTGRTVREVTDENPKWLLPSGLVKPKVLNNFHRVAGKYRAVILVEGPLDRVAVYQARFPNVVELLGKELLEDKELSYDQLRLIGSNFDQAVLLLDGDEDGQEAAAKIAGRLSQFIFVRTVSLPDEKDPSDLAPQVLSNLLSFLK